MKKIILISGKAESGKSTCAKYLKEKLESNGYRVATDLFAKYIKGYLKDYYGWDGVTKNEFYRTKLQIIGTDIIKEKLNFKAFHAKRIVEDIQVIYDDFDYVLIDDCRFRDEVYTLKSIFPNECISVRINRLNHKSKLTENQLNHRSECDLDDFKFDYVINTETSDIKEFENKIDKILGKALGE